MNENFNKIEQYLILFELFSSISIDKEIIKVKYRELARRFHPDITGRDTNKEMSRINEARDFLINNIEVANQTLASIRKSKFEKFAKIYQEAIIPDIRVATIENLEKSISLLKSILEYKDSKDLIKKYEERLNKLIAEENEKKSLYNKSILDINLATINMLRKAIESLNTLGNYKDSKKLIDRYNQRINVIVAEEKRINDIYDRALLNKDRQLLDKEVRIIINELKTIRYKDSDILLNHYFSRLNLVSSIQTRLENEKKEKKYLELNSLMEKAETISDFKKIISQFTEIKDYKNVHFILKQYETNIENILYEIEIQRKENLYQKAIKLINNINNNVLILRGINILKTIKNYKDSEFLISKATNLILDNEENSRKENIFNKVPHYTENQNLKTLVKNLKELKTVIPYKNVEEIIKRYEDKIAKTKSQLYFQALDIFSNANENIEEIVKSILILKGISPYKDAEVLITEYDKKIVEIKEINKINEFNYKEEIYKTTIIKDDEPITEELLKSKISILNTILEYKDSNKIKNVYKKHLRELKIEKAKEKINRLFLRTLKIYLPIIIFIISVYLVISMLVIPNYQYNQAVRLFDSGNYTEAKEMFNKNSKNKNSSSYLIAIEAIELLEENDYILAIELLETIDANIDVKYDESENELLSAPLSIVLNKTKDGFDFEGWELYDYTLSRNSNFFDVVIYLKSVWSIIDYNATFETNSELIIDSIPFNVDSSDIELPIPERVGYVFKGWFEDSSLDGVKVSKIESGTTNNVKYYAKWEASQYSIIFKFNNGEDDYTKYINFNSTYGSLPEPTKDGFNFIGWFDDNNKKISTAEIYNKIDNQILNAKWELITYDAAFVTNGGIDINKISFTIDSLNIVLPTPIKIGYSFLGWYNNNQFNGTKITEIETGTFTNQIFYAKWEANKYTVRFKFNDDYTDDIYTNILFDDKYGTLPEPLREGYGFKGWFDNEDNVVLENIIHKITSDQDLNAKWELLNYTISFNTAGGSLVQSINYNIESGDISLPKTIREGYEFLGWHLDLNDPVVTVIESGTIGDKTIYASWKLITYSVSFETLDSSIENPQTQIVSYFNGVTYPIIYNSSKTFMGWFDNEYGDGEPYDFEKTIFEDITLYAKWNNSGSLQLPFEVHNLDLGGIFTPKVREFKFYNLVSQRFNLIYIWGGVLPPDITFEIFENGKSILKKETNYSSVIILDFEIKANTFFEIKMSRDNNNSTSKLINLELNGDKGVTPSDGGRAYWFD